MSVVQQVARKKTVRTLGIIAGGLLALLLLFSLFSAPVRPVHERSGSLVFPDVLSTLDNPPVLRITTADTAYTLKELPSGWGLVESGGFPVRADRMEVLSSALNTLSWGDLKTQDPEKFERIGLGHPMEDGNGALIEILNDQNEVVGALISGRKDESIYGRLPNDNAVSFQLNGELPPLYTRQAWLNLEVVEIPPEVIKSVRLVRPNGDRLYLERPAGGSARSFRPAPPNQDDRLISRISVSGPGLAISRFYPTDVKPASELKTEWIARHITVTHDALEIDAYAYAEDDGYYVTLRAVEAGDGANRASSINAKAEGWAFKLAEYDWSDFAPEIDSLVRRAPSE